MLRYVFAWWEMTSWLLAIHLLFYGVAQVSEPKGLILSVIFVIFVSCHICLIYMKFMYIYISYFRFTCCQIRSNKPYFVRILSLHSHAWKYPKKFPNPSRTTLCNISNTNLELCCGLQRLYSKLAKNLIFTLITDSAVSLINTCVTSIGFLKIDGSGSDSFICS